MGKYNIDTTYTSRMNEKIQTYNSLVNQAEILNRDNDGVPTKKEGELYYEASKICAEIMNLNLSQRSVHAQWEMRKKECDEHIRLITKDVAPAPQPAAPAPQPAAKNSEPASKPVASASKADPNFVTKNACKDVSADTISGWYKGKPTHDLKDVVGMDEIVSDLKTMVADTGWDRVDDTLKISPVQSYLFYGPPGTGKTFIIEAFASELMDKGYKYIHLVGGDIHASLVGVGEKTVQIAFQEAIDNEPCIIFIDELEGVCVNRNTPHVEGHEKRLTVAFLEAFNIFKASRKNVIFMGATNHPEQVDLAILDRIKLVPLPLPSYELRMQYLESVYKKISLEEGLELSQIAEATENYSFRDLDKLTAGINAQLKKLAIEECRILSEDGTTDKKATDIAAAEAITSGDVKLTREIFDKEFAGYHPADKSEVLAELAEFERRAKQY